jgi:hypothetical protein
VKVTPLEKDLKSQERKWVQSFILLPTFAFIVIFNIVAISVYSGIGTTCLLFYAPNTLGNFCENYTLASLEKENGWNIFPLPTSFAFIIIFNIVAIVYFCLYRPWYIIYCLYWGTFLSVPGLGTLLFACIGTHYFCYRVTGPYSLDQSRC